MLFSTCVYATNNLEYNDYNLYTLQGTWINSGAFRSDIANMSEFYIYIDTANNQWFITGGAPVNMPNYPNHRLYLATDNVSYATDGTNTYYFIHVPQSDTFYAGPFSTSGYPDIDIYLQYEEYLNPIPSTPILTGTQQGNFCNLQWTPVSYSGRIEYTATGNGAPTTVLEFDSSYMNYLVSQDGYYYVQLQYTVDGHTYWTEPSNKIHYVYTPVSPDDPDDGNTISDILDFFTDIIRGMDNATSTVTQFIRNLGTFIMELVSWLPQDVANVFFAVVIIGLVFGLFIK